MLDETRTTALGLHCEREHPDADLLGLRVEHIADRAWRVSESSDDRLPLLLGFVEQRDDGFELMRLGDTFEWSIHDSLYDALHHIHDVAAETVARRVGSDLHWIT
ncbi:hypothetical protein GCM10011399_37480 [Subtercola lobariae]|uniref:Uncharacterized protein n=1 Tax=Subtercola lobariae TaxID=1588641 RepID=A0A917F4A9_9MICO|nr:hypothetical protein GCM10011399_37480 [Subtercola lobariae]